MNPTLLDQVEKKLKFHRDEVKRYEATLKLIQANPEAVDLLSGMLAGAQTTTRSGNPVTVKQATLEALKSAPQGLRAGDIRAYAKDAYGMDVSVNTLSTTLAKMRNSGLITAEGRVWSTAVPVSQKKSA